MNEKRSNGENDLETVRQLVVDAALTALDEDGLKLISESITYAKVFEHLRETYSVQVTRGSVHERIWDSHDHFRLEVVTEAVKYVKDDSDHSAAKVLAALLNGPNLTSGSVDERTTSCAREYGLALFQVSLDSSRLRLLQSMKALGVGSADDAPSEALREQLNLQVDERIPRGRARTALLLHRLGLRPKAELGLGVSETLDLLNSLTMLLYSGAVLNHRAGSIDASKPVSFASLPAESPQAWNLVSVAFKSILDFLCEVDPNPSPTADPPNPDSPSIDEKAMPPLEVVAEGQPSQRRSRAALKQMVLNAGIELLLRDGLALVPGSLSYAKLLKTIEERTGRVIPRRLLSKLSWSSQEEFRSEMLIAFLRSGDFWEPPVSCPMDSPVLREDGTVAVRQTMLRHLGESLSPDNSTELQKLVTVKAAMGEAPKSAANDAVRAAIGEVDRVGLKRTAGEVRRHYVDFGFTVRPETGLTTDEALQLVVEMSHMVVTGSAFAVMGGIKHASREYSFASTGPSGSMVDWTPNGVALQGFFNQLFVSRRTQPASRRPDLKLNVIGSRGTGERLMILIHGYGADENDLTDIVPVIDPDGRFFVVAPRGPYAIEGPGAGWYKRNEDGSIESGLFLSSLDAIDATIASVCDEHGFERSQAVILGFSQGGAMALATSLRESAAGPPGAVICLSGAMPEVDGLTYAFDGPLPEVLVHHGSLDPSVTIDRARRTRDTLIEHGVTHRYSEFPMQHEISAASLVELRNWLAER